jgi:Concanavalin A-like lectin/glucanases superfamily
VAFDFDGSSAYLELGTPLVTAVPLTLSCDFLSDSATADQALLAISSTTGSEYWRLEASGAQGGDPIRARAGHAGGASSSDTAAYVANRWTNATAVFAADDNRIAYKDGVAAAAQTTARAVSGVARTNVGVYYLSGSLTSFANARIANAAIWSCALTPSEVMDRARGKPPDLIRPENLILHLPLGKDTMLADLSRLRSVFANTAAAPVPDHPQGSWTPPRRKLFPVFLPSGRTLAGTFAEDNDSATVSGQVRDSASLSQFEAGDAATAAASIEVSGAALVDELADVSAIAGAVRVESAAGLAEDPDGSNALARAAITGSIAVQDSSDRGTGNTSAPEQPAIDPNHLFLAPSRVRRAVPPSRLREILAFPRIRSVIAANGD